MPLLPEEDLKLLESIEAAYQALDYPKASSLIQGRLGLDNIDPSTRSGALLLIQLACLLIDISKARNLRVDAEEGLDILERNLEVFQKIVSPSNLHYNIGNAKHSLFTIDRLTASFEYTPDSLGLLIEAKNSYLKALELLTDDSTLLEPMILVNLGTVLSESGRISEAIHCYDLALDKNPDIPQAYGCRAADLIWLNTLTGKYTKMLLLHVYKGLVTSLMDSAMPPFYRQDQEEKLRQTIGILKEHGICDIEKAVEEYSVADKANTLSEFQKYALRHGLFLSEHAVYCNCPEGCVDNIDFDESGMSESLAARMRLVLERVKSEFAFARWLYWQSINENSQIFNEAIWPLKHQSSVLTEETGPKTELLRASYRTSYSILDKIGSALCDMFDMPSTPKRIYFDKLWLLPRKMQTDSVKYRWPKMNSMARFPLIGLFSLATDLDHDSGEWSHFRDWRNALEHRGLFIVSSSGDTDTEKYELNKYFQVVSITEMVEQCLRLLQATAGAIMNFALCVKHNSKWQLDQQTDEE